MAAEQEWTVELYLEAGGSLPAAEFLDACPVGGRLEAIVESVRSYPPHKYPAGQSWHVMKKDMKGIHEARARNRNELHRLFCILDRDTEGILEGPAIVLLGGGTKPIGTAMDSDVYDEIVAAKNRYWATRPRPIEE